MPRPRERAPQRRTTAEPRPVAKECASTQKAHALDSQAVLCAAGNGAGSGVDSDVLASYRGHANAYVTKPLDLEQFERAVSSIHDFYGSLVVLPPAA